MFGAIKRLMRRSAPVVPNPPPSVTAETTEMSEDSAPRPEDSPTDTSILSAAIAESAGDEDCVVVPFPVLIKEVPKELYGKLAFSGVTGHHFPIPRKKILEQLSTGVVRVSFGGVRRAAPPGVFIKSSAQDSTLITIPLKEVLPQLELSSFTRRHDQRQPGPPTGIEDIFGSKGERLAAVRIMNKNEAANLAPAAAPAAPAAGTAALPVRETRPQTVAAPVQGTAPSAAAAAEVPQAIPAQSKIPFSFTPPASPSSLAARKSAARQEPKPSQSRPDSRGPAQPAPRPMEGAITVLLDDLSAGWPDPVRQEIDQRRLGRANCQLPVEQVEAGLKSGKVHFSWNQVRCWMVPPLPQGIVSPHGETILELPLKVIAPLYLGRYQKAAERPKVAPTDDIPDLFAKAPPGGAPSIATPIQSPVSPLPTSSPLPAPVPEPVSEPLASREAPSIPTPPADRKVVQVSVNTIWERWPDGLQREIDLLNLKDAAVAIPMETLEAALRLGKVEFSWKQVCHWIDSCPSAALASSHAETRLEIPLNVLAPVYLQQRPTQIPKKAEISIDVPNVFVGDAPAAPSPAPVASRAATALTPPVITPASSSAAPPLAAAPPRAPKDLAELFGEPEKRNWTPNEIVHHTTRLPNVAGALIALQDGLLVACCMPPEWRAEMIAAFLPQIFGRMNQYARELKLGDLTSVSFAVDKGILQVFNAGIIYFAALGRPGAVLPLPHLTVIASELSRHTK